MRIFFKESCECQPYYPTQNLSEINLDKYEVVASEPLHDIKGHIINIISELPYILTEGDTATKCTHLITNCLAKEKKSGADLRRAIMQISLAEGFRL